MKAGEMCVMQKKFLAALVCVVMIATLFSMSAGVAESAAQPDAGYRYFERSTPEENGISSEYISNLLDYIDEKGIEVHSLMIAVGDKVIYEAAFAPYRIDDIHVLNSLSKLMTVTATGILVDQGVLSLDDHIVDFFPEIELGDDNPYMRDLQVKHLLSMTLGHSAPVDGREDEAERWIDFIMHEPIDIQPGTKYCYDSSATLLMSAVITRATGKTNDQVLRDSGFLEALDIQDLYWSVMPEGFSNGAGGARMRVEDLLKIGMLYMNNGNWQGQQLLSEDWCRKALGYEVVVSYEGYTGYAFHWTNKDCGYIHATGAYGQHILFDPELNLTVAFVGAIKAIPQDLPAKYIIEPTLEDGAERSYDGAAYPALLARTEGLTLMYDAEYTSSPREEAVNGVVWSAVSNNAGLTGMRLDFAEDSVDLTLFADDESFTISSGKSAWTSGIADMSVWKMHGTCRPEENVTANAKWLDDDTLQLTWFFTNMPFKDTLTFVFSEDGAEVQLDKVTNIGDDPESFAFSQTPESDAIEAAETSTEAEAEANGSWRLEMTSGTFIVGQDIPEGTYSFRNTAQATIITIYADETAESAQEQYLYGEESVDLDLKEGQKLVLDGVGTLIAME